MTKGIARLAIATAAVAALALPAAPAAADHICYESPTIAPLCVL